MEPEESNTSTISRGVVLVEERLEVDESAERLTLNPPSPASVTVLSVQMRPTFSVLRLMRSIQLPVVSGSTAVVAPSGRSACADTPNIPEKNEAMSSSTLARAAGTATVIVSTSATNKLAAALRNGRRAALPLRCLRVPSRRHPPPFGFSLQRPSRHSPHPYDTAVYRQNRQNPPKNSNTGIDSIDRESLLWFTPIVDVSG